MGVQHNGHRYRAFCNTCNWKAPERGDIQQAYRDNDRHYKTAAHKAKAS